MKKSSNIKIKYSTDNRITIPREIVNNLKLEPGTEFYVELRNNSIVLTKIHEQCVICGKPADCVITNGKTFKIPTCDYCAEKLLESHRELE